MKEIFKCVLPGVEELFVLLIHPDLDHPPVVVGDDWSLHFLGQLSKVVRHERPVDMPNP